MPRRQGLARTGGMGQGTGGGGGGGSGTRAVRRRCIVLAKISIFDSGDGSEAGTFFSALTFGIFRLEKKEKN